MSLAYYIVLKSEIDGFDPFVDGKVIAHANPKTITKLCKTLGVQPLEEFLSVDPEQLMEEFDVDDGEEEQWFAADDGLKTVRALKAHLTNDPKAIKDAAAICEDLSAYEEVLERVKAANTQWHLAVDY